MLVAVGMGFIVLVGFAIPATRPSGYTAEDLEHPPTVDVCNNII